MTNESVVAELQKLHDAWAAATIEKDCWQGTIIRPDISKQLCADELEPLIAQLQPGILNPQPGATEREVALEEAAQLADPEKYTCEDSCAVGKVRDAILALRAPVEIPARPSIIQQSGKLPDSPVKRDSLNGPEVLAKPLTENQVRHSLDAASRGEWENINIQTLTEKLNAIICKKPLAATPAPEPPPDGGKQKARLTERQVSTMLSLSTGGAWSSKTVEELTKRINAALAASTATIAGAGPQDDGSAILRDQIDDLMLRLNRSDIRVHEIDSRLTTLLTGLRRLRDEWENYITKMREGSINFVHQSTKDAVQDNIEMAQRFIAALDTLLRTVEGGYRSQVTAGELNAVEEKSKRLEDLYMVIGALMFMAAALRNIGTVAHTERAKQCEALANYYDLRFVAENNDLSLPRAIPAPKQAGAAEKEEGVK